MTANSGQPKACMRLTRCMSMTLRERIAELLSGHRRGGRGGGAMDDVVLQGHGGDLESGRPGALSTARLGVDRGGRERAELLDVEDVAPTRKARTSSARPETSIAALCSSSFSAEIATRPSSSSTTCSRRLETSSMWWVDRMTVRGCSA